METLSWFGTGTQFHPEDITSFPASSRINFTVVKGVTIFSNVVLPCTLCACIIFIHLFTMRRNARVVSERHVFGRVSGGSDFPAGQMAALCGQCVCVDEGLWEEGQQPRGGRIAHTLALSSVPVQLCFSLQLELLICSICGRGHRVKQNTCLVAEARQAGTVHASFFFFCFWVLVLRVDGTSRDQFRVIIF